MKYLIILLVVSSCSFINSKATLKEVSLIPIGVAVNTSKLSNKNYKREIIKNFNSVTHENALKMDTVLAKKGEYNFKKADILVNFAIKNNLEIRGHPLIWHRQVPVWVKKLEKDELKLLFKDYIKTLVLRYKGKIKSWDVVNEAIDNNGEYRKSIWYKAFGENYIEKAFLIAKKYDSNVNLVYNDHWIEKPSIKFKKVFLMLKDLRAKGVPVNTVGLQSHFTPKFLPTKKEFKQVLKSFASIGLNIEITELDIAIKKNNLEQKRKQINTYNWVAKTCIKEPKCKSITIWGLSDQDSWVPSHLPELGEATLLKKKSYYHKKETYRSFLRGLK